ncbi:MAG: hypothetical protein ABIA97_02095 [Candidatus Omnitrophota bacterium]
MKDKITGIILAGGKSTRPLRFGLGIMFLVHGLKKAFGMLGGSGIRGFSEMLSSGFFAMSGGINITS